MPYDGPDLLSLDIANGTNDTITFFSSAKTPQLQCIKVDEPDSAQIGAPPYDTWIFDFFKFHRHKECLVGLSCKLGRGLKPVLGSCA